MNDFKTLARASFAANVDGYLKLHDQGGNLDFDRVRVDNLREGSVIADVVVTLDSDTSASSLRDVIADMEADAGACGGCLSIHQCIPHVNHQCIVRS